MQKPKTNISRFKTIEFFLYVIIWLFVFAIPYFRNRVFDIVDWYKVLYEWIQSLAFLIIFIFNVYFFIPKFLFKKKYTSYFLFTTLIAIAIIFLTIWLQADIVVQSQPGMPPMNLGPGMPPMELSSSMPAPMGYRPTVVTPQKSIYMIFTDYFIITLLVVGTSTTIKLMSRWINEETARKDIEKEQLKTELALLRHQVNPHFLMNTLNNIHALIDLDLEVAKDAVIKLSVLMRYLLYDSAQGKTTLAKELEFMESYIELMKLRYTKKIEISFTKPDVVPEIQIPPMLFISFLENAFKHGVSYQAKSYVDFKIEIVANEICCVVKNSKHINNLDSSNKKYSGIGMANVKKNLALIYKDKFKLDIFDKEDEYEVKLKIPIL